MIHSWFTDNHQNIICYCCFCQRSLATTTEACRTRVSTSSRRRTSIVVVHRRKRVIRRRPVLPDWRTVLINTVATPAVEHRPGKDHCRRPSVHAINRMTHAGTTAQLPTRIQRSTGGQRRRALDRSTTGRVAATAAVRWRRRRTLTVSSSRGCLLHFSITIRRQCLPTRTPSMTNCRSLKARSSRYTHSV